MLRIKMTLKVQLLKFLIYATLGGVPWVQAEELPCCEKFQSSGIIPDLIDACPQGIVTVQYPGFEIHCGEERRPAELQAQPTVSWEADPYKFYTLMMLDPDAPSPKDPTARNWQHWVVVNIPGDAVSQGQVLTEYTRPTPPVGTKLHRYVFLVYVQAKKCQFDEPLLTSANENRGNFDNRAFASKHHLTLVAAQYFLAHCDHTVPGHVHG